MTQDSLSHPKSPIAEVLYEQQDLLILKDFLESVSSPENAGTHSPAASDEHGALHLYSSAVDQRVPDGARSFLHCRL